QLCIESALDQLAADDAHVAPDAARKQAVSQQAFQARNRFPDALVVQLQARDDVGAHAGPIAALEAALAAARDVGKTGVVVIEAGHQQATGLAHQLTMAALWPLTLDYPGHDSIVAAGMNTSSPPVKTVNSRANPSRSPSSQPQRARKSSGDPPACFRIA